MASRHNLGHDLDPTGFRHLGGRGADLTLDSSGDITLGQGNCFQLTADSGTTLSRISSAAWNQGSPVVIQFVGSISVEHGATAGSGYYGIRTPTAATTAVGDYNVAAFVFVDTEWVMLWGGVNEVTSVPALSWTPGYSLDFSTLSNSTITGDGPITIDSKSWYAVNVANSSTFATNPGGAGLYIRCNATNSRDYSTTQSAPGIGITLSTLLGMSPNVELYTNRVRIWVQADWAVSMTAAQEHLAVVTGYSQYNTGRLTNLAWRARQWSGYVSGTLFRQHRQYNSLTNGQGDSEQVWDTQVPQPSTIYDVFMFDWDMNNMTIVNYYGTYGTTWPSLSSLTYGGRSVAGSSNPYLIAATGIPYVDTMYPFLHFLAAAEGSTSGNANILVKKLKTEYQ